MFVPDYTYYTETFKGDGVSEGDVIYIRSKAG